MLLYSIKKETLKSLLYFKQALKLLRKVQMHFKFTTTSLKGVSMNKT